MPRNPGDLDVDARFLLANERTALAWARTALALLAGAVGVFQFGDKLPADVVLTVVLLVLGAWTAVTGAVRYRAADRAMRAGELPKPGRAPMALAGAVVFLAAAFLLAVIAQAVG